MTGYELLLASHLLLQQVSATGNATSQANQATLCPEQKSARVDVRWHSEPIKYDHNQSQDELGGHHIDTKNPYGTHVATDVGGLMTGKITYQSGTEISTIRYPAQKITCLWINRVEVNVVMDPTIQIASEHEKGSCKYIAILEHESKHVAIDRAIIERYLQPVRNAAADAVQKVGMVGPKPDRTTDEYKEKMSGYIEGEIKKVMDRMYAERVKRQQALDSREEYDRIAAQCPDNAGARQ